MTLLLVPVGDCKSFSLCNSFSFPFASLFPPALRSPKTDGNGALQHKQKVGMQRMAGKHLQQNCRISVSKGKTLLFGFVLWAALMTFSEKPASSSQVTRSIYIYIYI